jgi:hypothetical protein
MPNIQQMTVMNFAPVFLLVVMSVTATAQTNTNKLTAGQRYTQQYNTRQAALKAEQDKAAQQRLEPKALEARGYVELTAKLLRTYPERFKAPYPKVWMDVTYGGDTEAPYSYTRYYFSATGTVAEDEIWFWVKDKDGGRLDCHLAKVRSAPEAPADKQSQLKAAEEAAVKLKAGDKVRLIGWCSEACYVEQIVVFPKEKE